MATYVKGKFIRTDLQSRKAINGKSQGLREQLNTTIETIVSLMEIRYTHTYVYIIDRNFEDTHTHT